MTQAIENKKLMQQIFAELSKGNSRPLTDSMADEFTWTVIGTTMWSRKFTGKKAVIEELLAPLRAKLTPPIIVTPQRFIADEDIVAVEARGKNTTKDAKSYNNTYCFVFRLSAGQLQEVTEYTDTALITSTLGDLP